MSNDWIPPAPDPCGEEKPAPEYIGIGYWECTLEDGHDGNHEDEHLGHKWARDQREPR